MVYQTFSLVFCSSFKITSTPVTVWFSSTLRGSTRMQQLVTMSVFVVPPLLCWLLTLNLLSALLKSLLSIRTGKLQHPYFVIKVNFKGSRRWLECFPSRENVNRCIKPSSLKKKKQPCNSDFLFNTRVRSSADTCGTLSHHSTNNISAVIRASCCPLDCSAPSENVLFISDYNNWGQEDANEISPDKPLPFSLCLIRA